MNDELQNLKTQILDELILLTDEASIDPSDKLEILFSRYVASGDAGLLVKAFDVAKSLEDQKLKGNALMQILEEIDISMAESAPVEPEKTKTTNIKVDQNNDQ